MTEPFRDPDSQALVFPADPAQVEIQKLTIRVDHLKEVVLMLCQVMSYSVDITQARMLEEVKDLVKKV